MHQLIFLSDVRFFFIFPVDEFRHEITNIFTDTTLIKKILQDLKREYMGK